MRAKLDDWRDDDGVELVVIRGAGERAFCAGGDIRALHDSGKAGTPYVIDFYAHEYRLNRVIKRYPKPYIALINGIVMGGGVGVSVHGQYRIAGEGCVFAMPETGIGLFPDVGGTYFLPRCPGEVGLYLGLTGARLDVTDAKYAGRRDPCRAGGAARGVDRSFEPKARSRWSARLPSSRSRPTNKSKIAGLQPSIDRHFAHGSVEEIFASLEADASLFAAETLKSLRTKSPTSLKVTYRQIREGKKLGFEDCMRLEFRLTNRFMRGHDFYEGVRAVILEKDNAPKWQPPSLEAVTAAHVDAYFAALPDGDLTLDV